MSTVLRIANASGFYGDRFDALAEQVAGGPIQVLTGDWLAELTMMLLRRDQQRDPELGYCRTFPGQVEPVLATCLERGIKIITNAGGRNPHALARAVRELATAAGLEPRIAVLDGDDVTPQVAGWLAEGEALARIPDGAPLTQDGRKVLSATAYLGAHGIATALRAGADIVITGRVTDPAVVIGPAAWYFGWQPYHYDMLASALVAGHILECGTQTTGGNHPFWQEVAPGPPGFPIAELHGDGSVLITKHPDTPGRVDVDGVKAQLLYEITGRELVSPDVVALLDSVALLDAGPDKVQVTGVTGMAPRATLKVAVELDAGWRNAVHLLVSGPEVADKVARLSEQFWTSVGGADSFEAARTDVIGSDGVGNTTLGNSQLVALSVRDPDRSRVGRSWSNRALELGLGSVPGLGLLRPPGNGSPCAALWPTLVPRDRIPMRLVLDDAPVPVEHPVMRPGPALFDDELYEESTLTFQPVQTGVLRKVQVGSLCGARSGDKGGDATLGVWVRDPDHYGWLTETLTTAALLRWLGPAGFEGPVEMSPLPNLSALLFVLHGYLGEGVGSSIHPDPQAKLLAEFVRSRIVSVDTSIVGGG